MTAEEIQAISINWSETLSHRAIWRNDQFERQSVLFLKEIAAQLAELNERLRYNRTLTAKETLHEIEMEKIGQQCAERARPTSQTFDIEG